MSCRASQNDIIIICLHNMPAVFMEGGEEAVCYRVLTVHVACMKNSEWDILQMNSLLEKMR